MADIYDLVIGRRVRARRKQLRISQKDLAKGLEIAFQQVQKYESGSNRIPSGRLFRISILLKIPVTYFFEEFSEVVDQANDESLPKAYIVPGKLSEPCAEKILSAFAAIEDRRSRRALLEVAKALRTSKELSKDLSDKF